MAVKVFTIAQPCRVQGKPVKAGDKVTLDTEKDAALLGNLLGSGRLVENPWSEAGPEPKDPASAKPAAK